MWSWSYKNGISPTFGYSHTLSSTNPSLHNFFYAMTLETAFWNFPGKDIPVGKISDEFQYGHHHTGMCIMATNVTQIFCTFLKSVLKLDP